MRYDELFDSHVRAQKMKTQDILLSVPAALLAATLALAFPNLRVELAGAAEPLQTQALTPEEDSGKKVQDHAREGLTLTWRFGTCPAVLLDDATAKLLRGCSALEMKPVFRPYT